MQVLYINLLEIKYLRKHTVVFRENRHRTSIFHCKSCAKTGIQSCAKSDSGAKFSIKITGRFSFMFQQPFRRETEIENFSNHKEELYGHGSRFPTLAFCQASGKGHSGLSAHVRDFG